MLVVERSSSANIPAGRKPTLNVRLLVLLRLHTLHLACNGVIVYGHIMIPDIIVAAVTELGGVISAVASASRLYCPSRKVV